MSYLGNGISNVSFQILNYLWFAGITIFLNDVPLSYLAANWHHHFGELNGHQTFDYGVGCFASCWKKTSFTSIPWRTGTKKSVIMVGYANDIGQWCPHPTSREKQSLVMGAFIRQFSLTYLFRWKCAFLEKVFFFSKIYIFLQFLVGLSDEAAKFCLEFSFNFRPIVYVLEKIL